MTDEEIEKMNALALEFQSDESRPKTGPANSYRQGYTAGHQDASAEKDKEISGMKEMLDFVWENGRIELVNKLQAELADYKFCLDQINKRVMPGEVDSSDAMMQIIRELASQKQAAEKLVEALEFYADGEGDVLDWAGVNNPAYLQDRGAKAKEALTTFRKGEGVNG